MMRAVIWLAGGRPWLRHFWFPVAFYLVAIPWPSQWEDAIVQGLTRVNTAIVVEWLAMIGIPAIKHGNVIEISRGLVSIDEACSGIRSLQATLMIALFFGELYRLSGRRRVLLVVSGAAVAFVCNMLRTFTLVWISSRHGNETMEKWHDPTGVAILLGCFTSLWLIGTRLRLSVPTAAPAEHPLLEIRPRWVAPVLCGWLVAIECANAAWFGFRDPAQAGVRNWSLRWPIEKDKFRDVELSKNVRALLAFDEGRSAAWNDASGRQWHAFHFSWGPAQNAFDRIRVQLAKTHRPEVCLPASGQELREHRGVKLFRVNGLELPFQAFRFDDRGLPLFAYFCAWEDGLKGGPSFMRENVASRLAAARAGSRSLSQRVLEVAVWGRMSNEEADAAFQQALEEMIER
jgi:exosortase